MYDAAEILGPINEPTDKPILGVGYKSSFIYHRHHNEQYNPRNDQSTSVTLTSPHPQPTSQYISHEELRVHRYFYHHHHHHHDHDHDHHHHDLDYHHHHLPHLQSEL